MEVGRRCTSGEGLIRFNVVDGNQVFFAIQEYVSAMTGRSVSTGPPANVVNSPTTAPQAPPSFNTQISQNSYSNELKQAMAKKNPGIKVLPSELPRERTHSAGARNIPPKPAQRPQIAQRGTQSVDDISSTGSAKSSRGEAYHSSASDEAVDRSKLPSPKATRVDFMPELHYDVATEPAPKQWPQRKETSNGKSHAPKPKPSTRKPYTGVEKSTPKPDAVNSELSAMILEDSGDPSTYASLDQPPGADTDQLYSEASDSGNIYDHLARQQVGNPAPAPRLPPPNAKSSTAPRGAPAKPAPPEEGDMLYDHLDRGQTVSTHPGSGSPGVGAEADGAYGTLNLDAPQSAGVPGGEDSSYLVSSYPPSTVPEESEYAEANDNNFRYAENFYELPDD